MRRAKILLLLALTVCFAAFLRAATLTNSLVWDNATGHVDADVHGETLWPLLEDIAHQTGWHIFVEPGITQTTDVKFASLPASEALKKLLGDLNFALVPKTNEPSQLYVFTTRMENATRPVKPVKPVVKRQRHVANELIVKLKPGADIDALTKSLGAKVVGRDDKLGIYRLEFPDAAATDAALAKLQNNSDVAAVDYNYIFDPPPAPRAIANAPVNATPVLTLDSSSKPGDPCSPIIGMIDTQMSSVGGESDPILLPAISVVGDLPANNSAVPTHATAMKNAMEQAIYQAAGGKTPVRILSVVVFDSSGKTTSWILAEGLKAADDNHVTMINMSLGGTADSPILNDIIQQLLAKGTVIFAAAGNQPVSDPTYPAAYPGVNDVTALGQPGQLASYANFSPQVDMALPGTAIFSYGGQSYVVQGTSPATAYATGVAAGTKGLNCPTWAQIQTAMQLKFPVPHN